MTSKLQTSFTGGEQSPAVSGRADLAKYQSGLKTARNVIIHAQGGLSGRAGTTFACEHKDSTKKDRLIPFRFNSAQAYVLVFGDMNMRIIKDGGVVLNPLDDQPAEIVTPYAEDALRYLKYTQSMDTMTIAHRDYETRDLTRTDHHLWGLEVSKFEPETAPPSNVSVTVNGTEGESTFRYKVCAVDRDTGEVSLPGPSATTVSITNATQTNPVTITAVAHGFDVGDEVYISGVTGMSEINDTHFTITNVSTDTFDLLEEDGTGYSAYVSGGTVARTFFEVTTSKDAEWDNTISYDASPDNVTYNIYRLFTGFYGFVGRSDSLSFTDDNIKPDVKDTPPQARNPFRGPNNNPGVVEYFKQRKCFANTTAKPGTIWMTQVGHYKNLSYSSPRKDDDSITRALETSEEVMHFVRRNKDLVTFTAGEEWVISGQDGQISYSTISADDYTSHGCSYLPPLKVGKAITYVDSSGNTIRDFGYELTEDSFDATDLTILARHLFDGKEIVDWAYAKRPHSIVWCVLDDGSLAGMTFLKEHEVWAWHRHDTQGEFLSVCTVPEGREDAVYLSVKRTINGTDKKFVERLNSLNVDNEADYNMLDCSLSGTFDPQQQVITGLDHLEGMTVRAIADTNIIDDLLVTDGAVDLGRLASVVHIGLPYVSDVEPLEIIVDPSDAGNTKRVSSVKMKVMNARGLQVGPDAESLVDMTELVDFVKGPENVDVTIQAGWGDNGSFLVRQSNSMPFTILTMKPEIEVSDD